MYSTHFIYKLIAISLSTFFIGFSFVYIGSNLDQTAYTKESEEIQKTKKVLADTDEQEESDASLEKISSDINEEYLTKKDVLIRGKVPAINENYFSDLNGSKLEYINAHHLGGFAEASLLKTDRDDWYEAQLTFKQAPGGSTVDKAPLYINPETSGNDYAMFGVALAGDELFKVSSLGDIWVARDIHANGTLTLGSSSGFSVDSSGYFQASNFRSLDSLTGGTNNFFLGDGIVASNSGRDNVAIGINVFDTITEGSNNTVVGTDSVINMAPESWWNVSFGLENIQGNGEVSGRNLAFGIRNMRNITTASSNIAVGSFVLDAVTTGNNNIGIGGEWYGGPLDNTTTGNGNIAIGLNTGFYNIDGSYNLFLGHAAGNGAGGYTGSDYNIALGYQSGYRIDDNMDKNVFIGYQSGYYETGSNKLYIAGSNTTDPLIYGEFDNDLFKVNGRVWISNSTDVLTGKSALIVDQSESEDILAASSSGTTRFVINNSGNIGIGTGNPTSPVEVQLSGYGSGQGTFRVTGTGQGTVIAEDTLRVEHFETPNYYDIKHDGVGILGFLYNGAERARFDSNGNFGIGVTPSSRLHVKAAGTGTIATFESDNNTGCTLADGGTISCSSDERLKENISDINDGLSIIEKLKPSTFSWKNSNGKIQAGFIAQDVEDVLPDLVMTGTNGYKSLNMTGIIPYLVNAVQKQQDQIDNLRSSNTSQNNQLAGKAIIPNGGNRVKIDFEEQLSSNQPIINVTPVNRFVEFRIENVSDLGFEIITDQINTDDIEFNWLVTQVEGYKTFVGEVAGDSTSSAELVNN